ncbi:thiamine-monophosphate kinase [Synechococcus sp. PCC 7335]|uniref:thiamine-phosphate kinase n=1 Tax=Synechococcus sp. (strain ATCC 29403 / PCC 7335) TaxID=91464 RepID=UPI00017EB162|nr:thiamine-phosphate kinase [Synechococcus sp. PCC 7335]EDX85325.1 thiamine-monophosphate kinase [Synechococcus sp. PCC 7335]
MAATDQSCDSSDIESQAEALAPTVADIGELALIERLKPYCATGAIGDDAATLNIRPNHKLVTTTDMLVEAVHFSDRTTPPYSVGWRAVAANLSDLAAMGAEPLAVTVGLGLPSDTPLSWVEALYQGMSDCLSTYGGEIVGGDLCRASCQTVSVTALGEVQPSQVICRNTAIPGMTVVVTGAHGASRAGLAVLLGELTLDEPIAPNGEIAAFVATWIKAHQEPVPRFDAIATLHQIIKDQMLATSDTYPVVAGMDSSDGLANALLQLSSSSGIGMNIGQSQIPLAAGLTAIVGAKTALDWALYGGEDFELVLCLPPSLAKVFTQTSLGIAIGTTTDTGTVYLCSASYGQEKRTPLSHQGFEHF